MTNEDPLATSAPHAEVVADPLWQQVEAARQAVVTMYEARDAALYAAVKALVAVYTACGDRLPEYLSTHITRHASSWHQTLTEHILGQEASASLITMTTGVAKLASSEGIAQDKVHQWLKQHGGIDRCYRNKVAVPRSATSAERAVSRSTKVPRPPSAISERAVQVSRLESNQRAQAVRSENRIAAEIEGVIGAMSDAGIIERREEPATPQPELEPEHPDETEDSPHELDVRVVGIASEQWDAEPVPDDPAARFWAVEVWWPIEDDFMWALYSQHSFVESAEAEARVLRLMPDKLREWDVDHPIDYRVPPDERDPEANAAAAELLKIMRLAFDTATHENEAIAAFLMARKKIGEHDLMRAFYQIVKYEHYLHTMGQAT